MSKSTDVFMKASHYASLQEILIPKIMAGIKYQLSSDGNVFVYGREFRTRPLQNHFVREAAQNSSVILTDYSKDSSENKVCAVSFTNCVPAKIGISVQLWFYTKETDINLLIAHVNMALDQIFVIRGEKGIGIWIHFPQEFNIEQIEKGLENRLGERLRDGPVPNDRALCGAMLIK